MNKIPSAKKIITLSIAGFIVLLIIVSILYLFIDNNKQDYSYKNPGGTGGDYMPKNKVIIEGGGILYKYFIDSDAEKSLYIIEQSILYNIPVSNDPKLTDAYRNFDLLEEKKLSYYKNDKSYRASIDDNKINFNKNTPRDYWLTLTIDDGRRFRVESIGSLGENQNGALVISKPIEN